MLQPIIHQLNAKRIILASGSPRRQEILRNIVSEHIGLVDRNSDKLSSVILGPQSGIMSIAVRGKFRFKRF